MKEEAKKKIDYITGAVVKIDKLDEETDLIELHADTNKYVCKKSLGVKVGVGYKFGIMDTDEKHKYEMVSVEQQLIKNPAFKIPGAQIKMVQMPEPDFKELVSGKRIKIRTESLKGAIDICKLTTRLSVRTPDLFKKECLKVAGDLEKYFD